LVYEVFGEGKIDCWDKANGGKDQREGEKSTSGGGGGWGREKVAFEKSLKLV